MGYKIGSFNLKNLGATALSNKNARDLEMITRIIKEEQFDVVALQEILSEGKAFISEDYAKSSIMTLLGSNWGFAWANAETNLSDTRNEGYAFIWNKTRLRLSSTKTINNTERVYYPRVCRLNKEDMVRRPYYARFTPVGTGGSAPWIELRLLCVHTYFGDDSNKKREQRQKELDVLMKDIYPQIADRRYGQYGNGMPSYTIILGDYNVQLWRPWKEMALKNQNIKRIANGKSAIREAAFLEPKNGIVETTKWGHRYIKTVQDQYTTLKAKYDEEDSETEINTYSKNSLMNVLRRHITGGNSQTGDADRGYAHDYDHFSYEEKQFEGLKMRVKRIDAVRKYFNDDFEKYHSSVSDHIPILMEIEFKNNGMED